MHSETTGGGGRDASSSGGTAGESSGGEEGAKGLKEWWGRFKAGKGAAVPSSSQSHGSQKTREARKSVEQGTHTHTVVIWLGEVWLAGPAPGIG